MKKIVTCLIFFVLAHTVGAQNLFNAPYRLWKPQKDEVYLQEVSKKIFTPSPLTLVSVYRNMCYALMDNEIFILNGEKLQKADAAPDGTEFLKAVGGKLWAVTSEGLFVSDGLKWEKADNRKFVDICMHQGVVHAATRDGIFRFENGKFTDLKPEKGYYTSDATVVIYEDDPSLRSVYLRSLERTWEVKRMEQIPWFNFVYGAITGNDCEADKATEHLREWVLDCTGYNYRNSHRDDLFVEPGYKSYEGGKKRISPREMSVMRASRSAIALDGGRNGNRVMEPTGFLRDYWMGRYHGIIEAPEIDDPELIRVKEEPLKQLGAAPFNGPPRPELY